jgi:hypothetical protein
MEKQWLKPAVIEAQELQYPYIRQIALKEPARFFFLATAPCAATKARSRRSAKRTGVAGTG